MRKGGLTLGNLIVNVLALMAVDFFLPHVYFASFGSIVLAALLLMILNLLVKPILDFVSLPLTCLSLGLFELVISAFILKLVDVLMVSVWFGSWGQYFVAVIIIALVNAIFGRA